ncbi:MAG: MFS transporter [Spirochaetaceae bacterium]|jgi:OFA family oxalate/formate antiporter-like MFS transporter|nr:MFS transporter [Spirochaetaceae bacterium]
MSVDTDVEFNLLDKTRWIQLIAGFVLLLFLGLIYAWSVFIVPLESEFDWNRQATSLTFTISMSAFCIGGLIAGLLAGKLSSGLILRICAVFVLAGFGFASRIVTLKGLYICYGMCVGLGIGLAYNVVISNVTRWFPEKAGFISGLLLMGFGLGGMVFSTTSTILMERFGWRIVFAGIAGVYFLLIIVCSLIISQPKTTLMSGSFKDTKERTSTLKDYTTKEMVSDAYFWLYFIWSVCLSAGGLAIIGHASPFAIDMGVTVSAAAFYAGLISVFNGTGRVVFGLLFDRVGRRLTMLIVSLGLVITSCILILALRFNSIHVLVIGYVCAGISYGGIMPCNSTVINKFYGQKHYPMNFSIITMNILIASPLGPFLAGSLQRLSGSYASTLYALIVFGCLAVLLSQIIRQKKS